MPSRRPPRRGQRGFDRSPWFAPSKPIRVEGGLQARSQRGRIGDTWWSQRFITVLESVGVGGRLQRGKNYARIGQVLEMEISPGLITASVQGSMAIPYEVSIATSVLTHEEWDSAEAMMESSAVFLAKLLAGDMPEEIEEAFTGSSASLFPSTARDLDSDCSCPDWANPCKHIAAVYFLLGEAFDDDPFLIFAWRGRTKEELLDNLRSRRHPNRTSMRQKSVDSVSESASPSAPGTFGWPSEDSYFADDALPSDPESPWGREDNLDTLQIRPRLAVAPDLLLRQLDAATLGADQRQIYDHLRPLYDAITAGAAELALGDGAIDHEAGQPTG